MMAGDPIPLPVIGEGQLELPWMTQIELLSFSWRLEVTHDYKGGNKSLLAAAAGMAAGAGGGMLAGGLGGQAGLAAAAVAAAAASLAMDSDKKGEVKPGSLKMQKRFDIASGRIHSCADLNIPVLSALISVLHIKQGSRSIHEPGFMLLATDGFIESVEIKMEKGDKGVEVIEDFSLKFKNIVITYGKRLGEDNIPMPPFVYITPPPTGGSSLPS
ncbi:MAG: hypothetical protein ABIQ06_11030 [Caldimonas sp.]